MIFTRYLYLKPLLWSQSISHYPMRDPSKTIEGTGLSVVVQPKPNCAVVLSNGAKLRDYEISLTIVQGEFQTEEHQKANFARDAIGGLWFVEDEDFVHGWFFFKPNNYAAVWDQVREGGYEGCAIDLGVQPVQDDDVWKGNPLSIVTASFRFDRRPTVKSADQQTPRKSFFARAQR
jgi:hypothetical protein